MPDAHLPSLDNPDDRLRWARERAGFKTATDAARRFHWNENTYRSHENATRPLSKKAAAKYAAALKVPVGWLLYNEGSVIGEIDLELQSLWAGLSEEDQKRVLRIVRAFSQAA